MKKIKVGLKPLNIGKVALIGADKAGQAAILGYALIDPKMAENIDENANYEVDIAYMYNLEEKTTKIHVKNFVQTTTDAPRTQLYTPIASEAKILKVVENNNKFATLVCKLDDGSSVAADAWYKQNSKHIPQVKDNDTWRMNLTLGGVYDGKNKINAFLRSSTSTSATTSFTTTTTTTTKAVEEPAKSTVKKFDFNHLGKALKEKGYDKYQETGKVQMGFITTCEKKTTVFNIRDIETFKLIANDSKLKELVSELAKYTKHADAEYDAYKKQLPCLFPMGYSTNNGAKDADMLSNGLFFYDYDGHSEEEMQRGIDKVMNTAELKDNLLYLAKSPSLKGFHAIFLPFNGIDNINQNQIHVDKVLQMPEKHDKSCKNIGRKKFMVPVDYIVYLREDMFDLPINQRLTSIGNTKKYTQKIKDNNNKAKKETTPIAIDYGYPITDEEKTLIDAYINENDYVVGQRHNQLQALCAELGRNNYPIQRKDIYIEYIESWVKTFKSFNENDEPAVRGENGVSELTSLLDWADTKGVIKDNVVPDEIRPRGFQDSLTWEDIVRGFNDIDYPQIIMDNLGTYFFEKYGHPSLAGHYFLPSQITASMVMLTPHLSGVEILCPRKRTHSILLQALHCADSGEGKDDLKQNNEKGFGVMTAEECITYNTMRAQAGKNEAALQEVAETYRKDNMSIDSSYASLIDNLMRIENYNRGTAIAFTEEYDEITKKLNNGDNGIPTFVFRKGFDGGRLDKDTKTAEGTKGNPRCKLSMNACGTLGSLIPLTNAIGDANNGTINRMMILPIVSPLGLGKTDNQYYDSAKIKDLIAYLRSLENITIDANYIFDGLYEEVEKEYLNEYVNKLPDMGKDYKAIVGRAIANAERVSVVMYLTWLYEQGLTLQASNEPYTYTTKNLRIGKEIEQPITTTYNEQAYMPVCMDKDGNLTEIPVANEELRKLFRVLVEMCIHGQYKLFDKMLAANSERIDKKFALIADEKKNISAKSEVFRRLPSTFTRDNVKELYLDYFPELKASTIRSWILMWKKAGLITEDEKTKTCTKQ